MQAPLRPRGPKRTVILYTVSVLVGIGVLFGIFPKSTFTGWAWWERMLLILIVGPLAAIGYVLAEAVIEGVLRLLWLLVRERPLETAAIILRISAIVDARFSLIVDGETASSRTRRGGAQVPGRNVAQPSTISLKRSATRAVAEPVLGLD